MLTMPNPFIHARPATMEICKVDLHEIGSWADQGAILLLKAGTLSDSRF